MSAASEQCALCPSRRRKTAVTECFLCLSALCANHGAVVVATGVTICSTCLTIRNEIGPFVPTVPIAEA